jgi:signal transduction histidine kinase
MNSELLSPANLEQIRAVYPASTAPSDEGADSPILRLLVSTDREQLAKLMTEQQYEPGALLFKEGDAGEAMYIVRSGRVAVVKGDFDSPTILGYRGPGEIIGEMALLEDRPRSASVVALDDLHVLCINRENFQQFLASNSSVGVNILGVLSSRLRAADEARKTGSQVTRRLTNQLSDLKTEKERLLELQRLRDDTSDLIVHDLRNPLSMIAGGVNLLDLTLPDDILQANRDILDLINSNVERMRRLVESLLDVTRMEAGETELIQSEINLPSLLKNTVERTATILKDHDLTIRLSIPTDLPTIVADEEKINRVLANLMDNAVKYTPNGGRITVSAEARPAEQILISIANTGLTIPPEDRERIFERFTRASGGQARTRGFGLGLAFCRLAVEAHGGKIWVEPGESDQGNRTIFSLPIKPQRLPAAPGTA